MEDLSGCQSDLEIWEILVTKVNKASFRRVSEDQARAWVAQKSGDDKWFSACSSTKILTGAVVQ
jgi:hypothetical protein